MKDRRIMIDLTGDINYSPLDVYRVLEQHQHRNARQLNDPDGMLTFGWHFHTKTESVVLECTICHEWVMKLPAAKDPITIMELNHQQAVYIKDDLVVERKTFVVRETDEQYCLERNINECPVRYTLCHKMKGREDEFLFLEDFTDDGTGRSLFWHEAQNKMTRLIEKHIHLQAGTEAIIAHKLMEKQKQVQQQEPAPVEEKFPLKLLLLGYSYQGHHWHFECEETDGVDVWRGFYVDPKRKRGMSSPFWKGKMPSDRERREIKLMELCDKYMKDLAEFDNLEKASK